MVSGISDAQGSRGHVIFEHLRTCFKRNQEVQADFLKNPPKSMFKNVSNGRNGHYFEKNPQLFEVYTFDFIPQRMAYSKGPQDALCLWPLCINLLANFYL